MHDIQALFNAISNASRDTRKQYHLTLGEMIEQLAEYGDAPVVFDTGGAPSSPHSYRGYYDDLSFERVEGTVTASRLLVGAKNCLGRVFEGYKGGDFTMDAGTPLWVAPYGCTGAAIVGLESKDGQVILITKIID